MKLCQVACGYCRIWITLAHEMSTEFCWPTGGLIQIGPVQATLTSGHSWIFILPTHIYCPISVKFGISGLEIMLLSICEVREDRR